MKDSAKEKRYTIGSGIVGLIIVGLIVWWGYAHFLKIDYSKPWFNGIAKVHACNPAAQSIADCTVLTAESDGNTITRITFSNGSYIDNHGGSCYEAYADPLFNKEKRVCQLMDTEGTKWAISP